MSRNRRHGPPDRNRQSPRQYEVPRHVMPQGAVAVSERDNGNGGAAVVVMRDGDGRPYVTLADSAGRGGYGASTAYAQGARQAQTATAQAAQAMQATAPNGGTGFAAKPYPDMPKVSDAKPLLQSLGATGTAIFSGIITSEEYNEDFYWKDAIQVYEQMSRNDAQIYAIKQLLELPIRRAVWSIEPGGSTDDSTEARARNEEIAAFVETCLFHEMRYTTSEDRTLTQKWDDLLRHILMMLWFGFMAFEVNWRIEDGWTKWARWTPLLPRTVWRWWVGEDNELVGLQQWTFKNYSYQFVDIPADKLLLFVHRQEGNNYEGVSVLRSAYKHWYYKDNFYKIEAIDIERNAAEIPAIYLPEQFTDEDIANAQTIMANMRVNENMGVTMPPGWKIEYIRTYGRQTAGVQPSIAHHDNMIARNVLGQFINLGSQEVGSYALADAQRAMLLAALQAECEYIEDVINNDAIPRLVDYNFEGVENYPRLKASKLIAQDLDVISTALNKLTSAPSGPLIHGDPDLEDYLRDLYGLPKMPAGAVQGTNPTAPVTPERPETDTADETAGDDHADAESRDRQPAARQQGQSQAVANGAPNVRNTGGPTGGAAPVQASDAGMAEEARLLREALAAAYDHDAVERGLVFFNPNHIPAGSRQGGQFAPKGGGAGGGGIGGSGSSMRGRTASGAGHVRATAGGGGGGSAKAAKTPKAKAPAKPKTAKAAKTSADKVKDAQANLDAAKAAHAKWQDAAARGFPATATASSEELARAAGWGHRLDASAKEVKSAQAGLKRATAAHEAEQKAAQPKTAAERVKDAQAKLTAAEATAQAWHDAAAKGFPATGKASSEDLARAAGWRHRLDASDKAVASAREELKTASAAHLEEQKAAAEERLARAKSAANKADREFKAAEKAADAKQLANGDEIQRLTVERHEAWLRDFNSNGDAREQIAEERARVNGEAGKAPKAYARMQAAKQPMEEARAAYAKAQPIAEASKAAADALLERYRANYNLAAPGAFDRLRKDHPDYKAADRQSWQDSSAADKAKYAMWRKEGAYKSARSTVAGRISEADIEAHPARVAARTALAEADAKLGEASGEAAKFKAYQARESARRELEDAQGAVAHPTWKYPLRAAPTVHGMYTNPDDWPAGTLNAARRADPGSNPDRHVGDRALQELQHAQGFDGNPDVVSEAELEQFAKSGEVEIWRGDTKAGHTDNLIMGEHHAGLGIRGSGTYAQDATAGGHRVASSYAHGTHGVRGGSKDDGLIVRMTIKKDARVIDHDRLKTLARAAYQRAQVDEGLARASGDKAAVQRAQTLKWLASGDGGAGGRDGFSRFATAMGYDAIKIPAHGQWIILNRTALRVSHQVRTK